MKKILVLVSALVLVLTLSACKPGTDPDPELVVTLAGLADQEITAGDAIDLMEGVTATGNDDVDYSDIINIDSDDCVVTNGEIDTSTPGTCHITYTAVVEGKMVRETITLVIKPIDVGPVDGPIVKEWTWETDADLEGWTKYEAGGGSVGASIDNGALKLDVVSGGLVYESRYEYMGLPFEDGQAYEITFKAKTDVAGKGIHFQVGELISSDPWFYDYKPGQVDDFGLTTDWVEYSFSFMYTKDLDSGFGGPLFEMGSFENVDAGISSIGIDAAIWIDDLVIKGGSGVDSLAPAVMGADDVTLFIEDTPTFDPAAGVTASDVVDGDLTADIVIGGDTVDVTTAGVYFVTYTVSDAAMNETVVTRSVTVKNDTDGPVLSGVEDAIFFLEDGQTELTGVMAMDDRDGDLTANIVLSGDTFDGMTEGTYNVVYTVTDAAGNETSATREIVLMKVLFADYTDNLINPNFDAGVWYNYYEDWNGADALFSATEDGLVIDIKGVGSDFWHVLIEQEGIVLEANTTYRFTFDAKSSVARDIQVEVAGATGITIGGEEFQATVSLTDTMTTYTVDIVVGDTATGGTVKFLMGLINGAGASVVTLDNVMIETTDGTDVIADTNQVEDPSFDEWVSIGWSAWSPDGTTMYQSRWREAYLYYNAANANPWENKLEQTGITMVPGYVYRVTFSAKGDAARDFIVGFWDGTTAFEGMFELGTDFQTYTWIFTYTGLETAALEFKLGQSSDNFAGTFFVVDTITIEKEEADTEAPVITLTGGSTTIVVGGTYTPPTCEVADNFDTDLVCVVGGDTVDVNTLGTYVVTYNVTDAAGNMATEVTHTVEVTDVPDTEAPVITLTGGDVEVIQGEMYTAPTCAVTDNVDAGLVCVVGGDVVDVNTIGTYVVTYNVTDTAGNVAVEVTHTVEVIMDPLQPDALAGAEQVIFDNDTVLGDVNTEPWYMATGWGQPDFTASTTNGVLTINHFKDGELDFGSNFWDDIVRFDKMVLLNGATYRVSIDASTSLVGNTADSMILKVENGDTGYWEGYDAFLVLDENTMTYELEFTWGFDDTLNGLILIMVGGVEQTLTISNLVIDADYSAIDDSPMFFGVTTDLQMLVDEMFDPAADILALDPQDGDLTAGMTITVLGPNAETVFDSAVAGVWTFTYDVVDADMNASQAVRTLTLVGDVDAPEFMGVEDGYVVGGFAWNPLAGVSFTDMDLTLTMDDIVVVVKDSLDATVVADANGLYTLPNGVYSVLYTLTDTTGNVANPVRMISVVNAPTVTNNLLLESDFSGVLAAWGSWTGEGGVATFDNTTDALVVDVTNVGGQPWAIQYFQSTADLVNGKTYAIVLEASSTVDRDILIELIDGSNQWTASLKDTTQRFVFTYTAGADVTDAKLNFLLGSVNGAAAGAITIDNVLIYEVVNANPNLVLESDFTGTLTAWGTWTEAGATFDNTTDAMVVDVTSVGGNTWSVQLFQEGINFTAGTMYTISFDASAAVDRDIFFEVINGNNQFTASLTGTTMTYTYSFFATADNTNVKINFLLGNVNGATAGAVTIDNVVVMEIPAN